MKPGIHLRLAIFVATILLLVGLIGWSAHDTWKRINGSEENLARFQWQSYQVADHLQQKILGLNNEIYLYAAFPPHRDDWTNIVTTFQEFQYWLDQQAPILSSEQEAPLLRQINAAYQDYINSAMAIHARVYGTRRTIARVEELADFETRSQKMLDLGFQLAKAQQDAVESVRRKSLRTLYFLRLTLLGALGLLVLTGVSLAALVYRGMIAPLKIQLVESRNIAERQEKLASLGMLAAGVAHEIRNPLTAIKTWLFLHQKYLAPNSPEFSDAQLIEGEINRLERIVKDFLQFARPPEPQFAILPARQPLEEIQIFLKPEFEKSGIQIDLHSTPAAQVRIDLQQIKQVLMNLVRNAAESIGRNGTITLGMRLDEKRIRDRIMRVVILEVSDTGRGLSPEAEKRLFDPFFTTKDHGTGLGLPIAARIVEKHDGALQYQNLPGQGATFGIILPQILT